MNESSTMELCRQLTIWFERLSGILCDFQFMLIPSEWATIRRWTIRALTKAVHHLYDGVRTWQARAQLRCLAWLDTVLSRACALQNF